MTLFTLSQRIAPYRKLLIGISGGLDSTVLLHRLVLLRRQQPDLLLRAIHVHHGLSSHADEWVTHCRSICAIWNVPLIIKHIILQNKGLGIEGEARKARYTAFANALLSGEVLVTAHNLDDQCETLLLALKRGSGPSGLSAMSDCIKFVSTQHLRPLLNISRNSLEKWAKKYKLCWIKDKSNEDDSHDRNFLRLKVIPLLVKRWPYFANAVARSAQLCKNQENLIDQLLSNELIKAMSKDGAILISMLQNKSVIHRLALLRRWIAVHRAIMPSRDMLTRIWNEVALARKDANPILHLNGFEIRRYQGYLWWVPCLPKTMNHTLYWVNLTEPLMLPYGIGYVFLQDNGKIRFPTESEKVTIRFRAPGILHIVGRCGGRKIKKIWQEKKIPPWRRSITPLLFYNETLIAAAGIFVTKEGFTETGMQLEWKVNRN